MKKETLKLKEQIKSLRDIIKTNNQQYMRLKSKCETLDIACRSLTKLMYKYKRLAGYPGWLEDDKISNVIAPLDTKGKSIEYINTLKQK